MIAKVKTLMESEGVRYVAFGILTVIVSWVSYALFCQIGIDPNYSNALSWVCAVLFAFVVNKIFVFQKTDMRKKVLIIELMEFFASRLFTGAIAIIIFPVLMSLGLDFVFMGTVGLMARGVTSLIEIALNYVLSKYFVFSDNKFEEGFVMHFSKIGLSSMSEDMKKHLWFFILGLLVSAAIVFIAFPLSGIKSEVGGLYFSYAEKMVSFNMPYSDFDAEYPPLAMLFILIPRFFSFNSYSYQLAFGVEVFLFLLLGAYFIYKIAERYNDKPGRFVLIYLLFVLINIDFVLDRYDAIPMILLFGALYFFLEKKYSLMWIMIALGTLTKLYPILVAPLILLYFLKEKEYKEIGKGIGICAAVGAIGMLPFIIADMDTAFMFLTYHMDRGMQVESVFSSVIMMLSIFDIVDIGYIFSYGSDNLTGDVPDMVASFMMPLMIVTIMVTILAYAHIKWKRNHDDFKLLNVASLMVVMCFMVFNKVLSSQYLIWIITFLVIFVLFYAKEQEKKITVTYLVVVALTQLNLVVNYAFREAGEAFSTIGIIIIFVRNIVLLALMYFIFKFMLDMAIMPSDEEVTGDNNVIEEI